MILIIRCQAKETSRQENSENMKLITWEPPIELA